MRYGPKEMQARGIPWLGCVRVWDVEVAVILASLIGPTRGELLGCAHGGRALYLCAALLAMDVRV